MTFVTRRGALALIALVFTALAAVGFAPSPADAAAPCPAGWSGPHHYDGRSGTGIVGMSHIYYCSGNYVRGNGLVEFLYGFDYNPKTNHLRAWVLADTNAGTLAVRSLRLGTRDGVLESTNTGGVQDTGIIETDAVSCHKQPGAYYIVNLYLTMVWSDGVYTNYTAGQIGQYSSVICR